MDPARYSGQRRPRLLRASATEPSIITTSIVNHGALDMSQPMSHSSSSHRTRDGSAGAGGGYRRATDLLNHVAYLSSCTTSPVSPLSSGPFFDRVVPRRFFSGGGASDGSNGDDGSRGRANSAATDPGRSDDRTSTPTRPSAAATPALPESRRGHNSRANRRSSDDEGAGHHDDLLGSSPASTHTSGSSLDRLHRHQYLSSAHYISFPSFDTWDPDRQDKEDDDDD